MADISFDQIWEAIKNLPPKQQRRLRKLLDALRLKSRLLSPEDKADLLLLQEGAISKIPLPPTAADIQAFREYKPIDIDGKPLSATIIEERR
jgi:hypothetical protein